jgi:hypothetical protein
MPIAATSRRIDGAPDDLGPFANGVRLWSRTIALASPDKRPMVFRNCVAEGATFVRKGALRALIAAELIERAEKHELLDALGGREAVEKIVAKGLADAPRQTANVRDKSANGTDCDSGVGLEDFVAYMPRHCYIFKPTRETWPASSVNARVPPIALVDGAGRALVDENGKQKLQSASAWLDQNRAVEQMTWSPGDPMLVDGKLISEGGWIPRAGCRVFNLYRSPNVELGNAAEADRWLEHVFKVFGDNDQHIIRWLAHRVQRPQVKINHALVLGGHQGIGKDTLLEPVKHAVGPWNFAEVSPQHMLGRFNGYLRSVILRVSEARDLGDVNRFGFYDHMKAYTAAPPDVLRVDEKHLREYAILNVTGVIITTNHFADGIYLPADDRRHFVAWSDLTKDDFVTDYWRNLWSWFSKGGIGHVAAYLAEVDLSGFDPKAPPPKTPAFWNIVDSNRAHEDAELADVLDQMGNPDVTTLAQIRDKATGDFYDWIGERKNRRAVPHRLERCGYVPVRNDTRDDGLWIINKVRQVIYARKDLSLRDRLSTARRLAEQ